MAIEKKSLALGGVLAVLFWVVLAIMFMPFFGGESAFKASDKLFNSISKGSTHYIPKLVEATKPHEGTSFEATLKLDADLVGNAETILKKAGLEVTRAGKGLTVKGKLGQFFEAVLKDADDMFYNKGDVVKGRYDIEERLAMFTWWKTVAATELAFKDKGGKENFAVAKVLSEVNARGVEVGYNYYKIEPESVKSKAGILIFSLIFYVVYTLWWGYAIFYLAEGAGLKLSGGKKKEV